MSQKIVTPETSKNLLQILEKRFKNKQLHKALDWNTIATKLEKHPEKMWSLQQMELTGGEPNVVGFDTTTNEYLFFDCSEESPKGRRSICYDRQALESRKENKPKHSAVAMAEEMGISLLTEEQYRYLQKLGKFDLKTSNWIQTPVAIRELGGAIFADFRYNQVFIYHNGAPSYYAARGFRGCLRV
ncbi:DUF4256 domain-containing protein [Flavobacterium sp. J27]|uniref:DUF4256 domain-containing protein n=1 Tax=Flavobacterium sp. J27 TaxID=2060419 RepID=UPI00102F854B|nr:DUF4256 domain-containing protein [Flavobacterium sp. J27]